MGAEHKARVEACIEERREEQVTWGLHPDGRRAAGIGTVRAAGVGAEVAAGVRRRAVPVPRRVRRADVAGKRRCQGLGG